MAILTSDESAVALYCSTTMVAFGPVFDDSEAAESFLHWVGEMSLPDPRTYSDDEWSKVMATWGAVPKCWICGHGITDDVRLAYVFANQITKPECTDCTPGEDG
jgi:hypothetical protein